MSATAVGPGSRTERWAVGVIYTAGVIQGVMMVSFAASSAVLRSRHGFTDTQYGSIFLPQVALAAAAAFGSGALLRVLDLRQVLALSFAALALSQAALAASHFLDPTTAFVAVMLGTSLLGLGAGLSASPLNTYPQLFFPATSESAVIAMHTAMGVGLSGGSLFVGAAASRGFWLAFPLTGLALCLVLLVATLRATLPRPISARTDDTTGLPSTALSRFWLFAAIAFLYAVAEAAYSNWAVLYLREEKGLTVAAASLGLAAFWLALSVGRLVVGLLVLRLSAERVYLVLPLIMALASLLLPLADTPRRAALLFGLAGLGCSAFYPLTVALGSRRFPGHVAWVSAMSYAALVSGIGAGSFLTGMLRLRLPFVTIYRWSALCPLLALLVAVPALALASPARPTNARE